MKRELFELNVNLFLEHPCSLAMSFERTPLGQMHWKSRMWWSKILWLSFPLNCFLSMKCFSADEWITQFNNKPCRCSNVRKKSRLIVKGHACFYLFIFFSKSWSNLKLLFLTTYRVTTYIAWQKKIFFLNFWTRLLKVKPMGIKHLFLNSQKLPLEKNWAP